MKKDTLKLKNVIEIDEARTRDYPGELVRGSVEETLNALPDAEADRSCNAARYERTEARRDTRAGSYERKLQTPLCQHSCPLTLVSHLTQSGGGRQR